MIESPLLQELLSENARTTASERAQRDILTILETRFGDVPPVLSEEIEAVADEDQLTGLVRRAASCPDLEALQIAMET